MARETRPAKRTIATAPVFSQKNRGVLKFRAKNIPDPAGLTISPGPKVDSITIRVTGANNVTIQTSADPAPQKITIKPTEPWLSFPLAQGLDLELKGVGGASDIEYILWG